MSVRAGLLAVAVALAFPAGAAATTSPHVLEDLEAAHAYWQTGVAVPEPADSEGPCRGRWNVIGDSTVWEHGYDGRATGVEYRLNSEGGWDWYVARCEFTMHPNIHGGHRRCVVAHEVGHFIHGPGHSGAMVMSVVHKCISDWYVSEERRRADAQMALFERVERRLIAALRKRSRARAARARARARRAAERQRARLR